MSDGTDVPGLKDEGETASDSTIGFVTGTVPGDDDSDGKQSNRFVQAFRVLVGKDVSARITGDPDQRIRRARASQENGWRNVYASVLLAGMVAQVIFADVFFWTFAEENDWIVEGPVVIAFFTSVVVEVIGLVLVITQSLFPRKQDDSIAAP